MCQRPLKYRQRKKQGLSQQDKNVKYTVFLSIMALFVPEDSREIINLDFAVFVVYNT